LGPSGRLALVSIMAVALCCVMFPAAAGAGHGHNNPPCWGNGLGDGTNSNYYVRPLIEFQGVSSCGYVPLFPQLHISLWWHPGPAGSGGFERIYLGHCPAGVGYCSQGLNLGFLECKTKAGVDAAPQFAHHFHDHHYTCSYI
jgi:hypothetical protein